VASSEGVVSNPWSQIRIAHRFETWRPVGMVWNQ
jgi:hypothetical protein